MPEITVAKTAGFCFGVNRAVNMVYDLIDRGEKVCTLGPIIHNPQIVEELARKGVRTVNDPKEALPGETLVIRSHGVGEAVYNSAAAAGVKLADATCPFVAKIHGIVKERSNAGDVILIAGDPEHQEVRGITGHIGGEYYVFSDEENLRKIVENRPEIVKKPVTVVSQTTFNEKKYKKANIFIKKVCTNVNIFDTICNATSARQKETAGLAADCDVMIVIGGRHSSNTSKLFDIAAALCPKTHLIETADEIDPKWFAGCKRVGVAAGASTPAGIIKEAIKTMSEIMQPVDEQMEGNETVQKSFEEMTDEEALEASLSNLTGEQKVVGTVVAVNSAEITVDIGRGVTGYVTAEEYSNDPAVDLEKEVNVGDEINLIIMKISDQDGTAMLSKRRYDAFAGWDKVVAAKESGEVLHGVVRDVIKGGVVTTVNGVRVFIPASQATASRNDPIEDLKGKEVDFRIIEIGRGRRAIGSIRSVLSEARKEAREKLWSSIAVGDRIVGTVKSVTTYGAFVDIGGVDGLVHISELSWSRIKHPSEVVNVGDEIEVYVKDLDPEKQKISLGYKKPEDNPWNIFQSKYSSGDTVEVTIVSLTSYGAFARIIPGVDGLIHISQISNKRVEKPQDELKVGQTVEVKITNIDPEKKRVSFSIRALLPEEEKPAAPAEEESTEDEVVATASEENVTVSDKVEIPEEEPAKEVKTEEAPAEEAKAEKAPAEEAKAEEAPAEEAKAEEAPAE